MDYNTTVFNIIISAIKKKHNGLTMSSIGLSNDPLYVQIGFRTDQTHTQKKFEEFSDQYKDISVDISVKTISKNDEKDYSITFNEKNAQVFFERLGIGKFGKTNPVNLINALTFELEYSSKMAYCCPICKKYEKSLYYFCCETCRDTKGQNHDEKCNIKECNEEEKKEKKKKEVIAVVTSQQQQLPLSKPTQLTNLLETIQIIKARKDNIEELVKQL